MKSEKLQVRCEKEFKLKVEEYCKSLGISSAEWIRGLILKEWMK